MRIASHLKSFLPILLIVAAGCRHATPTTEVAGERLRVGFFVGAGSNGPNVINLGRLLAHSPQVELTLLDGKDVRAGQLEGKNLLVIPGGSSATQYKEMQEAGAEAIRNFVSNGGSYFGVCAGFHCALNRDERIRLLPYTWYFGGNGMRATLNVELNEKAAERLQVPAGKYQVRYSRGPVSRRCEQPGTGWAEELAVYKDTMAWPKITFDGAPAMLYGEYGKGKVIATSFHPEYFVTTHPIALGCVYAVTGVKITPVFPKKRRNPIRVAYLSNGMTGKPWVKQCLELDRQADIDLQVTSTFSEGILEHVDVVVCPHPSPQTSKSILGPADKPPLKDFLDNGGKVLIAKSAKSLAIKHGNVAFYSGDSDVVAAVRKAAMPH